MRQKAAERNNIAIPVQNIGLNKLTPADIQVGDLIFYESLDERIPAAKTAIGDGRVHHVEICTEAGISPTITGQVNRTADVEKNISALQQTRSTALKPKPQTRYIVLHCQLEALRLPAAKNAVRWCSLAIAFDRRGTEPNPDDKIFEAHRKLFLTSGRFRAIRYTARRSHAPQQLGDDPKPTKGMFCSHFVVACYQVAGLTPFVRAAGRDTKVQDKRGVFNPEDIPEKFRAVVPKFDFYRRRDDANDVKGGMASISFWDFDKGGDLEVFPWEKFITKGMEVDSKKIMPRALLASLLADKTGWKCPGVMQPELL